MPVLLIVGVKDHKFVDIARNMKLAIGSNATMVEIQNAGHSVHLEQTHQFQTVVENFLK
jgi:2-succinyl-6-hydroxy-2,4-cyclohexadiene-1-carboxylate synthase